MGAPPWGASCAPLEVQKHFYTCAAFVPYGIYEGRLNKASTVIEAFLQKKKCTPAAVSGVWCAVDYRCKLHAASFTVMPDIQWETATKVRIALWDKSNAAVFIVKVAPQPLTAGFSMSDERKVQSGPPQLFERVVDRSRW